MKTVSAAFKAHLAQPYQTVSTCWLVVLQSGAVRAFTDHNRDIVFDLEAALGTLGLHVPARMVGSGSQTYRAAEGYSATNIQTSAALNVDNLEAHGVLVSPSITEADLHAGIWDFAFVVIFEVNYSDLTMGPLIERVGTLGQVTIERGTFKAEMRGMTQPLTRVIGELTGPACRASLGDERCQVDLTPFTVTSTLTGVNVDNTTLYDTARTEAGPPSPVAITGITNANPGVVTMASGALGLIERQPVTIYGVVGPVILNTITLAYNPSGSTFELAVDTSDTAVYPPYISGGHVSAFGVAGYFDYGVLTFNSGANAGLSFEVHAYVPGQITLALPLPYAAQIGDAYTMHAGCDKQKATCISRFNNIVNFRGEPDLAGLDALLQVGRR